MKCCDFWYTAFTVRASVRRRDADNAAMFPPALFAYAFAAPITRRTEHNTRFVETALFRRTGRFSYGGGDAPEPAPAEEPPLTDTERALYIGFACWVGLTFFTLFALVIFMHTPGNAN